MSASENLKSLQQLMMVNAYHFRLPVQLLVATELHRYDFRRWRELPA
jgi:hypothetical protein